MFTDWQGVSGDGALAEVPEAFQRDYAEAGLALVYDDCHLWSDRLRDFLTGSPKQASLIFIQPYLKNLERIGVFLKGQGGIELTIRIGYQSETAAKDGGAAIKTLIDLTKMNTGTAPADRTVVQFLDALQVQTISDEVCIRFTDAKLVDTLCQQVLPEKISGWTDILSMIEPSETPGAVKLACRDNFAVTGFLAQQVQAGAYRGKRVRVLAEIGANEAVHRRCGTIIWGSDADSRSLGNVTSGKTVGRPLDPENIFKLWNDPDTSVLWQTKSVEWNVPDDCTTICFGTYLSCGEMHVRNVKFEVLGPATSDMAEVELTNLPRNLLQIPGRKLLEKPTNLDFSEKSGSNVAPVLQSASRESAAQQQR